MLRSTTVFSHSQTVVLCGSCSTVLCTPTGGRARLTEGERPVAACGVLLLCAARGVCCSIGRSDALIGSQRASCQACWRGVGSGCAVFAAALGAHPNPSWTPSNLASRACSPPACRLLLPPEGRLILAWPAWRTWTRADARCRGALRLWGGAMRRSRARLRREHSVRWAGQCVCVHAHVRPAGGTTQTAAARHSAPRQACVDTQAWLKLP